MSEVIDKINELFSKHGIKTVKAQKIELQAEAKLENGTTIHTSADAFAPGAEVYTKDDDGEAITLPDGEYTLEDGSKIKVEGGKIAEVMAKKEDDDDEKMSKEEVDALVEKKVDEALSAAMEKFKTELSSQIEAKDEEIKKIKQEFADQDGVPRGPRKKAKEETKVVDLRSMDVDDRIQAIHEKFNSQK